MFPVEFSDPLETLIIVTEYIKWLLHNVELHLLELYVAQPQVMMVTDPFPDENVAVSFNGLLRCGR